MPPPFPTPSEEGVRERDNVYTSPVIILGIDPGLATVGIGVIDAENAQEILNWEACIIQTEPGVKLEERLNIIAQDLNSILKDHQPDLAVVEKIFFATNAKTAIDVAQARGVILQTLAAASIPILEPTPLQLKSAITGDGKADKQQLQEMLARILNIDKAPQPDDASDALGLAIYGTFMSETVESGKWKVT